MFYDRIQIRLTGSATFKWQNGFHVFSNEYHFLWVGVHDIKLILTVKLTQVLVVITEYKLLFIWHMNAITLQIKMKHICNSSDNSLEMLHI